MHPLWIMFVGVIIVLGGILVLRVHAFLALLLAALAVAILTPRSAVLHYWIDEARYEILASGSTELVLEPRDDEDPRPGDRLTLVEVADDSSELRETSLRVERAEEREGQRVLVARSERPLTTAPDDRYRAVIAPIRLREAMGKSEQTAGQRVATALGNTCGKIGILIAMAAIIGKCLLDSGAAERIVRAALGVFGPRGAPAAFWLSGFLLGVPVFFDTVFYLMMPLGKAMTLRTGRDYLLYILTIVAGATMAHSLVPPTPGPLIVAQSLNVDLGLMLVGGSFVGLFSSGSAYFFAAWVNRRNTIPLRESPDVSFQQLEELSKRKTSELPPLWLSLTPIVLPVALIAGNTVVKALKWQGALVPAAADLGNPNIALTIATLIAMGMLIWRKRAKLTELTTATQAALAGGGVIVLITSAGGAFGGMLQQTGVASLIRDLPAGSPQMVIALAFLVTAAVRTAQGSATVAMITAVGILAGLADTSLGCHPLYLALAIGCGSKPVSWMNDSGFWIICKISGMTEAEGLRFVSPMSVLMGVVGLAVTLALATLFPMSP